MWAARPYFALQIPIGTRKNFFEIYRQFRNAPPLSFWQPIKLPTINLFPHIQQSRFWGGGREGGKGSNIIPLYPSKQHFLQLSESTQHNKLSDIHSFITSTCFGRHPRPSSGDTTIILKGILKFRNIYRGALVETGQTFVHTRVLRRPDGPSQIRPSIQVRRICPENKHHGWNIHRTWFVSVSQFHTPETSWEAPHFEWLCHSEHLNNSRYRKNFWKNYFRQWYPRQAQMMKRLPLLPPQTGDNMAGTEHWCGYLSDLIQQLPVGRDFPQLSRPALRPTQPPVQWVPGLSRG